MRSTAARPATPRTRQDKPKQSNLTGRCVPAFDLLDPRGGFGGYGAQLDLEAGGGELAQDRSLVLGEEHRRRDAATPRPEVDVPHVDARRQRRRAGPRRAPGRAAPRRGRARAPAPARPRARRSRARRPARSAPGAQAGRRASWPRARARRRLVVGDHHPHTPRRGSGSRAPAHGGAGCRRGRGRSRRTDGRGARRFTPGSFGRGCGGARTRG